MPKKRYSQDIRTRRVFEVNEKGESVEHPTLTTYVLALAAAVGKRPLNLMQQAVLIRDVFHGNSYFTNWEKVPMALPTGVAEVFASRLGPKVGVKVAPVTLTGTKPTSDQFQKYFVKPCEGGYVLSERVEKALPIYFLNFPEKLPNPVIRVRVLDLLLDQRIKQVTGFNKVLSHASERIGAAAFREVIDKASPIGRQAYKDFSKADECLPAVLRAAAWSSEQRLRGHCFRALLRSTFGHSSNTLVTANGELVSIDFGKLCFEETTTDIQELHSLVKRSPRIMNLCRQISTLTDHDIKAALAVPEAFWREGGMLDNPTDAAKYFKNRLRVWKELFKVH